MHNDAHECPKTGKIRFPTVQRARETINLLKVKSRRSRRPERAYHCKHCNGWHLTSNEEA